MVLRSKIYFKPFSHYFLLFTLIFAISCKKNSEPDNIPLLDKSVSPFAKELYTKWISYAKDNPNKASLSPNEELDWQKIAVRISSDPVRSINYYVPILNNNQPCTKALELSFGAEKNIFEAAIRTYVTPSDSDNGTSEKRRLQTILFNFSKIGLSIPKKIVERETDIQYELKQKNIANAKDQKSSLSIAGRAGSSATQSSRNCETSITFDFYYIYSNNTAWTYAIQIDPNTTSVANYFRNEVLSYMKYAMNLDYELSPYTYENTIIFYDIPDSNYLGNAIFYALYNAANSTQSTYNLSYSVVDYYAYDVNYSTCGNTGGGGGSIGGSGGGSEGQSVIFENKSGTGEGVTSEIEIESDPFFSEELSTTFIFSPLKYSYNHQVTRARTLGGDIIKVDVYDASVHPSNETVSHPNLGSATRNVRIFNQSKSSMQTSNSTADITWTFNVHFRYSYSDPNRPTITRQLTKTYTKHISF